jgi:hypothetical protein
VIFAGEKPKGVSLTTTESMRVAFAGIVWPLATAVNARPRTATRAHFKDGFFISLSNEAASWREVVFIFETDSRRLSIL